MKSVVISDKMTRILGYDYTIWKEPEADREPKRDMECAVKCILFLNKFYIFWGIQI